ncbi:MAG: hypothetical protein ACR2K1_08770 [Saprospiraceae bacterium]
MDPTLTTLSVVIAWMWINGACIMWLFVTEWGFRSKAWAIVSCVLWPLTFPTALAWYAARMTASQ